MVSFALSEPIESAPGLDQHAIHVTQINLLPFPAPGASGRSPSVRASALQATVHKYACEQCHQLLWVEDSWSSASSRGWGGGNHVTKKGVSRRGGRSHGRRLQGWWGGVIEDKGRQMGQTMGHRQAHQQPPPPSDFTYSTHTS